MHEQPGILVQQEVRCLAGGGGRDYPHHEVGIHKEDSAGSGR